ncbi:benzoate-CoA ligase family protein [Xanthobacter sediminis]
MTRSEPSTYPYSAEWRAWRDPEVEERFEPTALLLDRHVAAGHGARIALTVDARHYSYGELLDTVERAAAALAGLGLRRGERILIFGSDSLEFIAFWLGAVRIGAVPVVVSDAYRAENLLYFLEDTDAAVLLVDAEQIGKLDAIAGRLPDTLRHVVVRPADDGTGAGDDAARPPRIRLDALLAQAHPSVAPARLHRNDIAYMFYSGGTTGTAKGIPHLVHDFRLIPERQGAFWSYTPDDVVHATSKKFFTHGLWPGVLIPLYWGARAVISRAPAAPEHVIALVERERPTKLISVPTIVKNLLAHVEESGRGPDFASVRLAITASEKVPPEIFERFRAVFGVELMDSIGSSEVTYEWIANRPEAFRRGSLGQPVFGYELRLVDRDGALVTQPGVAGEAEVRSTTGALFYWRKLEKSLETFHGGWARTGDELFYDADGFFWFAGRSNDVFKVKGLWVSPVEIEAELTAHEAVYEAAVVPAADGDGLTQVSAHVVLRPGCCGDAALEEELRERVRRALGGYKVPRFITFAERLPRTTLLKIDRRTLREAGVAGGATETRHG